MRKYYYLLLALVSILILLPAAGHYNANLDAVDDQTIGEISGAEADYDKLWQQVKDFDDRGLPKSALEIVEKIYRAAKEKNQADEFIKALIHKMRYLQNVEEEALIKTFDLLKTEIAQSRFPATPVLHSMLAQLYWSYYENNRYRFLRRTAAAAPGEINQDDIRTWDLHKIVQQVVEHYRKSLEDAEKSKNTRIDIYDKILSQGGSGRKYRPSLYDFLVHRAVDFFMNSEAGLTQPVFRFSLDKEEYFAPAGEFVKQTITSRDPLSFQYFALAGLQEAIRFHLEDENPEALIDVDLKRLRFLYKEAVIDDRAAVYEKTLEEMIAVYGDKPGAAEIYYELAALYNELGDKYKPRDKSSEIYKWSKKKAFEICSKTIEKLPGTFGAYDCARLIDNLESRKIKLTLEKAIAPNQPAPALLEYKNIKKIYLHIVKTSRDEIEKKSQLNYGEMIAFFIAKKAVSSATIEIPDDGDFQEHRTEIKIDALETGEYALLAGSTPGFDFRDNFVAYSFFTVTNIAYTQRFSNEKGLEFYLMHRETGAPLGDAAAQVWFREYDRAAGKYIFKKGPLFKPDVHGYFSISRRTGIENYFYLDFTRAGDRLFVDQEFYAYNPYDRFSKRTASFFFTDRSIYRPGQTLHFKGLMLNLDNEAGENSRILPNYSTRVVLYDVNQQQVSQLTLTTNEFGTFSGTFQLPVGQLNGQMHIADSYGSAYFSVEEYKRPKFQVSFDPLPETYKLGDVVKIKGKAVAYAGYNIDNADVKYRVVRNVFYPYSWRCWWYTPPSPSMEILNETCKTDAQGEFEITFTALPDLSISKELQPAFNFKVSAEATDINGETQEAATVIPIGYTALKIGVSLPDELDKDKDSFTCGIRSTNLAGDFVPASGSIAFYRLKENERITRSKSWEIPDRVAIPREEYIKTFPHEPFGDEDDFHRWEKEKKVFQQAFDTAKSKELKLTGLNSWKSGKYAVEMDAVDRYGSPVKELSYFTLYSPAEKTPPFTQIDWLTVPRRSVEPGEKALLLIGSSAPDVQVVYEIEHRGKIVEKKYLVLSGEQTRLEIPIQEKHRGNLGIHLAFIKYNRLFTHSENIIVPWSNKDLDISFETFRDKLQPGEKEQWRLKIKPKMKSTGQAAQATFTAEMLATLYDSSLDAFRSHDWSFDIFPSHYNQQQWYGNTYFNTIDSQYIGILQKTSPYMYKYYDELNWFEFYPGGGYYDYRQAKLAEAVPLAAPPPPPGEGRDEAVGTGVMMKKAAKGSVDKKDGGRETAGVVGGVAGKPEEAEAAASDGGKAGEAVDFSTVKARSNFQETAFFYPQLRTGPEGEIVIAFTAPEALTSWKMLGFAHTKDLQYGLITNRLVTQKELMVVPNAPRFLREGDTQVLTSKITNLSEKEMTGKVKLMLFDAVTLQPVDAQFKNNEAEQSFKAGKGESAAVNWTLNIPEDLDTVTYRIVAKAGQFSDGEEQPLPILKNRMLVSETLPLPLRSLQAKDFQFEKLINSAQSTTLKHHKLTLEFTSNPVWYAVQALPYLMEYPYECLEQVFSRYYANSIASYIVNSNPKIKRVFDAWQNAPMSDALLSNLEKNQELKTLLLEETPWVMNARNESERKKRIALLFDLNKMAAQMQRALQKLKEGQMASGAWPWFHGMHESRYITQHIVSGLAHLDRLQVIRARDDQKIWSMLTEAVPYLDRQIDEDYRWLLKNKIDLKEVNIGYMQVHYLYARSYFQDIPMDDGVKKAFVYYKDQAKEYWLKFNIYMQGMIALALNRYNDLQTPQAIIKSLKEHALYSPELGMYWKSSYGYYWYEAPIETHALLIEVFSEIAKDEQSVDELKTWLLKQKQTQDWRTTKATAEACYALLLRGGDWLAESKQPDITIGRAKQVKIEPQNIDNVNIEAGTGYFKTSWSGGEITPDMGYISIKNNNKVAAWGGLYWQYFENLDKITPAETPLQLKKELFIEKPSAAGPVLEQAAKHKLQVGDKVKVRIELRVDRTMEYVHLKDMRAAGFEPINVISQYKWQDGLGYYESTKDASTNFFFDYLPKGTYVFEYPLRVSHAGDFSNGITTIQCMYAPEFSSHSAGIRVQVSGK